MKEIWKTIKNYPMYEVSNLGRIKSYYRRGRIMNINNTTQSGYRYLSLRKDKKAKTFTVCRLVATYFVPKSVRDTKLEVNHKNGIKTDDRSSNLEWISHFDNMQHAFKNGLIHSVNRDWHGRFVDRVCLNGHKMRGVGFDEGCPECEAQWK